MRETIRAKAKFDLAEIAEIEKRTNHDVIAFLENVASYVGPACRWMHQGHDFVRRARHHARRADGARRRISCSKDLRELREVIARRAQEFKTRR